MIRRIQGLGWIPDLPDHRDRLFVAPPRTEPLPASVDLRPGMPPIYDQGALGSCTGNGISAAIAFDRNKLNETPTFIPSRLFIYYNERVIEGTVASDSGAMIRDGIKAVAAQGVCSETTWPYDIAKYTDKPSDVAYSEAAKYQVTAYARVSQDENSIKECLAAQWPVVFGVTLYTSFEGRAVARNGNVPMPGRFERAIGGHCMAIVGYTDNDRKFLVRNSWSSKWGDHGHCWMSYDYLTNSDLADDFWQITAVQA